MPGTADLRIQQPFNEPRLFVDVDRSRAQDIGLTQRDVAGACWWRSAAASRPSPTFWLDPKNGVSYNIADADAAVYAGHARRSGERADHGQRRAASPAARTSSMFTPCRRRWAAQPMQILGNLASITRGAELATVTHYDIQPVIDIYGNVVKTDLRSVADKIRAIIAKHRKELPRGSQLVIRGQVQTMRSSFIGLVSGLVFSILLVYLLIVVNFQSWLDPFIIISALPAALAGIVWILFLTGTHISVPALTGSIMCMGVATANSILVVTFAREQLEINDGDAAAAALAAGFTRFRPVLMTALAMIIGMVPMALGLGDGGEQNAPLGRAVIGGLIFATVATLFFVPTFFSVVHGALERRRRARDGPEWPHFREATTTEHSRTMSEPDNDPEPRGAQPASRAPA